MKKIIAALVMLWAPVFAFAAGAGMENMKVEINLENKASLQRGAQLFVNYCLSCHSASVMRYNRLSSDLGLSPEQVEKNLIFTSDFSKDDNGEPTKIGSLMQVALREADAKTMFGTKIPDLSVVGRSRGADWLYTYLMTFYVDESRPTGVNNQRFPSVGMPHVLWELEGLKKPVYGTHQVGGHEEKVIIGYETVVPGKMNKVEFANAMRDLTNYMVYMAEPAKLVRYGIGIGVLFFLFLIFIVSYALKKEYWKDVH